MNFFFLLSARETYGKCELTMWFGEAAAMQAHVARGTWRRAPAQTYVQGTLKSSKQSCQVKWSRNVRGQRDVWCEGRLQKFSSGRLLQPPSTSFQDTNIFMYVFVSVCVSLCFCKATPAPGGPRDTCECGVIKMKLWDWQSGFPFVPDSTIRLSMENQLEVCGTRVN